MARASVSDEKLAIAAPLFSIDAYDEKSVILIPEDYDATQQSLFEGFPERKWRRIDNVGGWVVPVNQPMLEYLKRTWKKSEYTVSENANVLMTYEELTVKVDIAKSRRRWDYLFNDKPTDFSYPIVNPSRKPFMHQLVAVEAAYGAEYFGLLMEMGTGKTKCTIDEWMLYVLRKKGNELLKFVVVCPKSLMINWEREIRQQMHMDLFHITITQLKGELASIDTMMEAFRVPSSIKIFIVSYDSAAAMLDQLVMLNPTMLVCDESHYIKNPESKRFKAVRKIADVSMMRRILTGTPVSNNIMDVWSQFEILRPGALGYNTYAGFKRAFCEVQKDDDTGLEKIEGHKNLDKLKENMARMSFIVKKEQCLDLPEQIYDTRYISMPENVRKIYKEIANNFYTKLENGNEVDTEWIIVQMLKLSQICCGFVSATETYMGDALDVDVAKALGVTDMPQEERKRNVVSRIPNGDVKLNAMLEDIEELVHDNRKVIVWSRFRIDNQLIHKRLAEMGIWSGVYDGSTSEQDKQDIVDAFNNNDDFKVFIGNTGSGGVGLTLLGTKHRPCDASFFYSNDFSYGKRQQAEARNHRIGQTHKVVYRDYVYENTIEEYICSVLQEKRDLSEAVKDVRKLKEFLLNSGDE